jgi:hypothetical protein
MALTKVTNTPVYAIASTASNTVDEGSALDVSTYYGGKIRIHMGRGTGTAFTTAPQILLQWTAVASPTADDWGTEQIFIPGIGASIASQAVSGTEAAAQTVVTLAAGTSFAAGDYVFFHNTTIANSEWCRVQSVSGADLTLSEGLVNAQTGSTCRDQAEEWSYDMDLVGVQKIRIVVNGAGSGQAVIVRASGGFVSGL